MMYAHDPRSKLQQYQALKGALWTERAPFDSYWADIAEMILPTRPRFWAQRTNQPDRRAQNIIDNTAKMAVDTLSSGLHTRLTSPATPWMKLTTPDPGLAKYPPVNTWLFQVTELMLGVLNSSNFYTSMPTLYQDIGVFGTAAMACMEDDRDVARFYPYPIGSFGFSVDERGKPGVFARESTYTVLQLIGQFGGDDGRPLRKGQAIDWSRFSRPVKEAWDAKRYEHKVQVCWVVAPNTEKHAKKAGARYDMDFSSCHFELGGPVDGVFLRESGVREFPVVCPRWDASAEETYGTACPGMTALGDVNQLQTEQKRKGQAIEKMVFPALQAPDTLQSGKSSMNLPDDVTYVSMRDGRQGGIRPIHEVKPDLGAFLEDIHEVQYRIKRAFYEPTFLTLASIDAQRGARQMTAREVNIRQDEGFLALGQVIDRTYDETLKPVIDRVFSIMNEKGLIPPAPEELRDVPVGVKFISLMAQAQRLVGIVAQDRFLESATAIIANGFPEARYKIKPFRLIDNYADILGIDPDILVSDEDAQQAVEAERQALQEQAQAEQLAKTGAGMRALSQSPVSGDNALNRIVEATREGMPGGEAAA